MTLLRPITTFAAKDGALEFEIGGEQRRIKTLDGSALPVLAAEPSEPAESHGDQLIPVATCGVHRDTRSHLRFHAGRYGLCGEHPSDHPVRDAKEGNILLMSRPPLLGRRGISEQHVADVF